MSAAAVMASAGFRTLVFEKNTAPGGRLRKLEAQGFTFDMGPSWYWMPDVFERFFQRFGHSSSDFYQLVQLDPGFQVIYDNETIKVPAAWDEILDLFEREEPGAADKLNKFMTGAAYKYDAGINHLIYQPGLSLTELMSPRVLKGLLRLQVFNSFSKHVRRYFKSDKLIALMEFPVLFLGAMPKDTPALYSLMNYAGLKQGTFYPIGGFSRVTDALITVARQHGAEILTSEPVQHIRVADNRRLYLETEKRQMELDGVIAAADYAHVDSRLLEKKYRNYSEDYWNSKTFAPSCLIFYLGIDKKLPRLEHHNLFFDADFTKHARAIYESAEWPVDPLFYVCCPSKTDTSVAPIEKENLFVLMPIAPGLSDNESTRQHYFSLLTDRLEKYTGQSVRDAIVYSKSYCVSDFIADYNSFKGNAYGLANTLRQTANLRPSLKNRRLNNLFYAGQLTVPGPGVPPSLVSGQVAAEEMIKHLRKYETTI